MNSPDPCPKCGSVDFLQEKMLLISKLTPEKMDMDEGRPRGSLYLHQFNDEFLNNGSQEQFLQGLYCTKCGIGFIPDYMIKGRSKE